MRKSALLTALLALMPVAAMAQAQTAPSAGTTWPTQQIRLIVPYSAGGTTDFLGRLAADYIGKHTGQNVIVENRTGQAAISAPTSWPNPRLMA